MRNSTPNAAAAESAWLAPSAKASSSTSTPVAHTMIPMSRHAWGVVSDAVGDTAPLIVEARPTSPWIPLSRHLPRIARDCPAGSPSPGQVASIRVRTAVATEPMSTASRSVVSTCTTRPLRQDRLVRLGVVGQRIDAELRLDLMYLTARGPRLHPIEQDLGNAFQRHLHHGHLDGLRSPGEQLPVPIVVEGCVGNNRHTGGHSLQHPQEDVPHDAALGEDRVAYAWVIGVGGEGRMFRPPTGVDHLVNAIRLIHRAPSSSASNGARVVFPAAAWPVTDQKPWGRRRDIHEVTVTVERRRRTQPTSSRRHGRSAGQPGQRASLPTLAEPGSEKCDAGPLEVVERHRPSRERHGQRLARSVDRLTVAPGPILIVRHQPQSRRRCFGTSPGTPEGSQSSTIRQSSRVTSLGRPKGRAQSRR